MNKCIKINIKNCKELNNKELFNILFNIRYLTCKASNEAIRMYYIREYEKLVYKEKNGKYPNDKDQFGKTYRNVVETVMKSIMNTICTSNVSQTNAFVMKKWNTDKKDILNNRKSLANYKQDMPIYIYNKNYKIFQGDKGYEFTFSPFNKVTQKDKDIKKLTFEIDKLDGNKKATLNRLISGEYKQGSAQIKLNRKNKWEIIISFSFELQSKSLDYNRVLGIDLGIVKTATMQVWDNNKLSWDRMSWKESFIDGKELIHFRQKIEARKRELCIASKIVGQGRTGHGYKTRMKPIGKINDKIARFRDTFNHKVSKYIIGLAIKHNCGTIQMEDLTGFSDKQSESLLKNWSYYDLQNKIAYKAKENGIELIFINPQYTSKRCSKCGCIHDDNRNCKKNQGKFKCIACGHEDNADINAAKNIAIPGIGEIIQKQLKVMF